MISVVCWKWRPAKGYRTAFDASHVNTLRRMVARHYARPHRFLCVTDDPAGIDPGVEIVPLWADFADLASDNPRKTPSCYRRLRAFHPAIGDVLGPRFVSLDLDCVILADVAPLWDRPEPFVCYGGTHPKNHYNGSMFLLTAGARPQVWEQFDPVRSLQETRARGAFGTDQAWLSLVLGAGEARWGTKDGVYSYRLHGGDLQPNARIVMFNGQEKPWDATLASRHAWVRNHYQ